MKDPYSVIKHPVSTEKAVRLMESENKLTFIVDKKSSKGEIKDAIQKIFNVKVIEINTFVTSLGIKKAYIQLSKDNPAMDIATQLGII